LAFIATTEPSARHASTFEASTSLCDDGPSNQTVPLVIPEEPGSVLALEFPDAVRLLLPISVEVERQTVFEIV
jgi:hypothetical protein